MSEKPKGKKKLYFISPAEYSLSVYYQWVDEKADVSSWKSLNTGYNDNYEMRPVRIGSKYFSDDFNKLKPILDQRKLRMVENAYKELAKIMEKEVPGANDAYLHDSIDSPL